VASKRGHRVWGAMAADHHELERYVSLDIGYDLGELTQSDCYAAAAENVAPGGDERAERRAAI
jgi:hypothetical protein